MCKKQNKSTTRRGKETILFSYETEARRQALIPKMRIGSDVGGRSKRGRVPDVCLGGYAIDKN
jgi:hypothetical protein